MKIKIGKNNLIFFFVLVVVGVLYFVSRYVNLTKIPVFADEAIYLRWAQVMRSEPSLRFLPLSDGKQPLFMWLAIPFLKLIADPLFAGRVVSVLVGFAGLIGIGLFSWLLYRDRNLTVFSAILYLIAPYIFFFNRLALPDNQLMVGFIWTLNLYILSTRTLRLDTAMLSGIALGLSWLTKSPAVVLIILLPSTLLLFNFRKKGLPARLGRLFGFWLIVLAFGFAIYNILRLGSEFHMIALRNKDYVFPLGEIVKHPLFPLLPNIKMAADWFWVWLTPLLFLLGIPGGYILYKNKRRESLFVLVWLSVPLVAQCAIARVFTARYVLFLVPFWLVLSAGGLNYLFSQLKSKTVSVLILSLIFFLPVYQLVLLTVRPESAWLPGNEREGYLEMWTAGYGIRQTADYIKKIAPDQKILVGTEGYFGTLPDGLQMYLEKVPNVTVIGVGWPIREISDKLTSGLVDSRVFLVVNQSRFEITDQSHLKLIDLFPKAADKNGQIDQLLFYEIIPS